MAVAIDILRSSLEKEFPESDINIVDLAGDNDHYEVRITSSRFNGLSKIAQHKLVYDSLGGIVGNQLHALALKTFQK